MGNYFKRVTKQTPTRFWINNVTTQQARMAIDAGAVGCTQNPSYTWKILQSDEKDAAVALIDQYIQETQSDDEVVVKLQRALVEKIAEIFLPMYEATNGKCGYVSIQGSPFKEDVDSIVEYGRFNREHYPNIMVKVPVTEDGLKAISVLLREGTPINATEVMAVHQAIDLCQVYEEATKDMEKPPVTFYSHIAGIFDEHMAAYVKENNVDIDSDVVWQAGIAVAKKVYQMTKAHWPSVGLISGGARGLHHFTEMVGADGVVTINWNGTADKLIEQDAPVVQRFLQPTPHEVVDELYQKIPEFRKAYFYSEIDPSEYEEYGPVVRFRNSFEKAWACAREFVKERRAELNK